MGEHASRLATVARVGTRARLPAMDIVQRSSPGVEYGVVLIEIRVRRMFSTSRRASAGFSRECLDC